MREQPLDDEPWVKGVGHLWMRKDSQNRKENVCLYEFVCVCVPFFNAYI